jgi:gas vesicle protein
MVMTIAEDMKKLTENIIISNDVRVKALGDLVADTHKTLRGFATDRKKMAAEQAKSLADFVKELSKNVQSFLGKFQKDHQQMSKEQAKSLADFVNSITKDVGSMLSGFEKDRGKMSKELKDKLAKEVKEIETYVAKKLKEFNNDHADMSEALKKELNGYVMGIVKETRMFLKECGSEMSQARKAWQGMSATMAKSRKAGFPMHGIDAGEKVTTVGRAISRGKKRTAKKSESSRQEVGAGV